MGEMELPFEDDELDGIMATVELLTNPETPRPIRQAIQVCIMADRIPMEALEEYRSKFREQETTMPLLHPTEWRDGGNERLDRALTRVEALIEFKEALPD